MGFLYNLVNSRLPFWARQRRTSFNVTYGTNKVAK